MKCKTQKTWLNDLFPTCLLYIMSIQVSEEFAGQNGVGMDGVENQQTVGRRDW